MGGFKIQGITPAAEKLKLGSLNVSRIYNGSTQVWPISLTPITDANIQTAVNLWVSDPSTATTTYGAISTWDVSNVTDMSELFRNKTTFNDDISNWDVSSVTDMNNMFSSAYAFNQDIGGWDVSSVINMRYMFHNTQSFNQDIGAWDVSSVTNMGEMFFDADVFNQDINTKSITTGAVTYTAWDVSSVTNMVNMFYNAVSFDKDIGSWDTSSVTGASQIGIGSMYGMFAGATLFNQDINTKSVTVGGNTYVAWDVSNVNTMRYMFLRAYAFDQDISTWDVSSVVNMENMFKNATDFNKNLSGWCVTLITSEPTDFSTFSSLTSANKPVWGTCPP